MRVHLRTFGCRANQYDTEAVRTMIEASGHAPLQAFDLDMNRIPDAAMTAAVLALFANGVSTLRKIGSRLQGHPDPVRLPFLEAATGSLGQGLSIALGMALAARTDRAAWRTYPSMARVSWPYRAVEGPSAIRRASAELPAFKAAYTVASTCV